MVPARSHDLSSLADDPSHAIGELCVGGDWASAHGDLSTLAHIAEGLARFTHEPFHHELVTLAGLCRRDPERAAAEWARLRPLLFHG